MRVLAAVILLTTMPAASALNPGVALGIDLGTSGVRAAVVEKKTNGGVSVLDLDYAEDSNADADANFVLTSSGAIVEIQGTAEKEPFSEQKFMELLSLARAGCVQLVDLQRAALTLAS